MKTKWKSRSLAGVHRRQLMQHEAVTATESWVGTFDATRGGDDVVGRRSWRRR